MKYLVGMSGGIDSSVAAVKLKKEGHDVIGVHMILWAEDQHKNKCCNTADMMWARQVCNRFDIPFYTLNFKEYFKEKIVDKAYLEIHEEGKTPNPCVSCNRNIRFGAMLKKGLELGVDKVCTGHYAKVEEVAPVRDMEPAELAPVFKLKRGVDDTKDQSYFLHRVTQEKLAKMHFPLGDMKKDDVKKLAEEWELVNTNRVKLESQDLCFLPEKTPEPFLKRHMDEKHFEAGDIVTEDGKKVGNHRGMTNYTMGQRKGLDIGGLDEPLYVIGKDSEKNHVVVGTADKGFKTEVKLRNLNLIDPNFDEKKVYDLKLRYRGKGVQGTVKRVGKPYSDDSGELWDALVVLKEPQRMVTPGQFVVMYDGDECLGGGEIV
ncbi:MAG: tRNA 2-thiouridine(34) synthase MnmA [Candidatus Gracilibacteria bacterium]|nr:tRNA 2-thiouridine(34) synthase MnmA [Candidatus Gracilibacteria bacterium]